MLLKNNIAITSIVLLMLSGVAGFGIGCSNPNNAPSNEPPAITYKTFQMKPDDIRLQSLQHPLFSLEYPGVFNLVDLNLAYENGHAITQVSGLSDVMFTIQQKNLPEPVLWIRVQEPGFAGYNNASDEFRDWIVNDEYKGWVPKAEGDTITTGERTVFGIQANYLEAFGTIKEYTLDGHLIYPEHQKSFRGVVFDYAGLIWSITMTWDYFGSEPPEVQEYFEHVIETFKILK